jgi:tetratricopeptide (TPR) repeat protein
MDDLNQALLLDPARGDALVLRAAVWRKMDMLDEARSDIDKAIALDPEDAEALLERGILRQRDGRPGGCAAGLDTRAGSRSEQRNRGAGGTEPDPARRRDRK